MNKLFRFWSQPEKPQPSPAIGLDELVTAEGEELARLHAARNELDERMTELRRGKKVLEERIQEIEDAQFARKPRNPLGAQTIGG